MKNTIQDKAKLVNSVFSEVYNKYDFMNDVMSLGVHRIWKDKFIDWMNPQPNTNLIDVASGTGDVAKLFYDRTKKTGKITCAEPNSGMLKQGKKKLMRINTVSWIHAPAEKLTVNDNSFDYYSISVYGLVVLLLSVSLSTFIFVRWLVDKFIYNKIKLIYKNISDNKAKPGYLEGVDLNQVVAQYNHLLEMGNLLVLLKHIMVTYTL